MHCIIYDNLALSLWYESGMSVSGENPAKREVNLRDDRCEIYQDILCRSSVKTCARWIIALLTSVSHTKGLTVNAHHALVLLLNSLLAVAYS